MFSRGLSTSVILYTSALVLSVILGMSIFHTMIIMAIVSIAYTTIGGIMADVYSDIIQLIILYGGVLVALIVSINILGGDISSISIDPARLNSIDFSHHGFGDGQTFRLLAYDHWMLFSLYGLLRMRPESGSAITRHTRQSPDTECADD